MGLDMYLNKMPRYKEVTAKQVSAIESYFDWIKAKEDGKDYANCTFREWCGLDLSDLPSIEAIEFYRQFNEKKYSVWDTDHKYGFVRIMEEVGYWRKANAIHSWFVDHVQSGEDDCDYHDEVTKEVLYDLLTACETVLASCEMVDGKITNGYTATKNGWKPDLVDGKYVKNTNVAEKLLPTARGFFFGSTDYDEYYIQDIENTIDIINRVLDTTDFEKEMVYYVSSW